MYSLESYIPFHLEIPQEFENVTKHGVENPQSDP
jgi:hypothetical protein